MITDLLLLLRIINSTKYFIPSDRVGNHSNVVLRDQSYVAEWQNPDLLKEELLGRRERPSSARAAVNPADAQLPPPTPNLLVY